MLIPRGLSGKKTGTPLEVEPASSPLKDFETSPKVQDHLPDSHHGFQGRTFRCLFSRFVEVEGKELFRLRSLSYPFLGESNDANVW